jgi:hypothetical protein
MDSIDAGRAGLCASCVNAHAITSSKGSTFLRCELSFHDPRYPRYPPLPVLRCDGYSPATSSRSHPRAIERSGHGHRHIA